MAKLGIKPQVRYQLDPGEFKSSKYVYHTNRFLLATKRGRVHGTKTTIVITLIYIPTLVIATL